MLAAGAGPAEVVVSDSAAPGSSQLGGGMEGAKVLATHARCATSGEYALDLVSTIALVREARCNAERSHTHQRTVFALFRQAFDSPFNGSQVLAPVRLRARSTHIVRMRLQTPGLATDPDENRRSPRSHSHVGGTEPADGQVAPDKAAG